MKNDENSRKTTGKKGVLKKLLIICAIIMAMSFVISKAFDTASNAVESMSQEEKDAMNDKWDNFINWLNED